MTNQQHELSSLVAYAIGARGEEYNPAVIVDTVRVLYQQFTPRDLAFMITDEHPTFEGIEANIKLILNDTYSDAAMQR